MSNAATSTTGIVTGSGTIVTFNIRYLQKGVFLYVDYNSGNGTNATMTIGFVNPRVAASNSYQETIFATATLAPITATLGTTGRYRFQLTPSNSETSMVVTFAFNTGTTQVIICDLSPE